MGGGAVRPTAQDGKGGAPPIRVLLSEGASDPSGGGLAVMLADLIGQNLAREPRKQKDFDRLSAVVSIEARDAEVSATLAFGRGALLVHGEAVPDAEIRVSAESSAILDLARIKIRGGVPIMFDARGRALVKGLLTGAVKIGGLLRHPVQLVRLTRLLSVEG